MSIGEQGNLLENVTQTSPANGLEDLLNGPLPSLGASHPSTSVSQDVSPSVMSQGASHTATYVSQQGLVLHVFLWTSLTFFAFYVCSYSSI